MAWKKTFFRSGKPVLTWYWILGAVEGIMIEWCKHGRVYAQPHKIYMLWKDEETTITHVTIKHSVIKEKKSSVYNVQKSHYSPGNYHASHF